MKRYDIAIIGMGGVFPGANNVKQYWKNIVEGGTFIKDMPKELWDIDSYYSPDKSQIDKQYTKKGAFIEGFEFPYRKYKYPPNTLKAVDPAQRIALESTREALEDAGITPNSSDLDEAVTVLGVSGVDDYAHASAYLRRHNYFDLLRKQLERKGVSTDRINKLQEQFDARVGERHNVKMEHLAVGAIPSALSNRVAQVFGSKGYNMTVDAACASSFGAIEVACHALMAGDARIAITGGVDLGVNPAIYIGFCRVEGISFSGISNPFDHTADGLVIGEGGGVVILKRLEDALADGDEIKAVIQGLGSSSDGAGQAIYNPSVEGRANAFRAALKRAEITSHDVQFLEAHATSTIVGDANEYDAIAAAYAEGRKADNPLYLGSVKYQIGHLKAGAGVAGLIKTVMAMQNHTIPHMPLFEKLTPKVAKEIESFVIPTRLQEWETNKDGKRIAAVTSSGFGGCNYHLIVEHMDKYVPTNKRKKISRDIAVVGVSVRVPGADNVDDFWDNVTRGKKVFTPADVKELGWDYHFNTGPADEQIYTKVVSKISPYSLNYLKYKIFPNAVSQISSTQFLALDLADRLLEGAGYDFKAPKNIGISVGSIHDDSFPITFQPMVADDLAAAVKECDLAAEIDSLEEVLAETKKNVFEASPPITEHTLPGWMGNIVAGRVANKLNLIGPNMVVDSACSSGLSAMIPAIYQLAFGDVEAMISGGLNRQMTDVFTSGVSVIKALAQEDAKPYDEEGAGYVVGEGGVLYLLKRLEDAKRDGDDIIAVIHSINGTSEAETKSMLAPTDKAVHRAINKAFDNTYIPKSKIGVVDTHGSANKASDLVEARSIAEVIGSETKDPVHVTAIKSHIGHLYGGSAASSMLSVIQTLRTGKVPGIRNLKNVRKELKDYMDRISPVKKTIPYSKEYTAGGVLSLGLGGTNYFAVVSLGDDDKKGKVKTEKEVKMTKSENRAPEAANIFTESAENIKALGQNLIDNINSGKITSSEFNDTDSVRIALTYGNESDLVSKMKSTAKFISGGHDTVHLENQGIYITTAKADDDRLSFCFPGQGTHYISMAKFLYDSNDTFRKTVDEVDSLAKKHFDFNLVGHIYAQPGDEKIEKKLGTLVGAQISLYAVEVALAKVLEEKGLAPEVLVGHSFGEISAMTYAGVWSVADGFQVVKARIEAAEESIKNSPFPLGMMSINCSEERRDKILSLAGENLILTNVNAPGRYIFAGELEVVKKAVELADSFGIDSRLLPIGSAFHSRFMEPAKKKFRKALEKISCSNPRFRIMSTITGEYIPMSLTSDMVAEHLSNQLTTGLNLPREIGKLHSEGFNHFLEIGPGWSMTKMITAILEGKEFKAVPTLHPKIGDSEVFNRALAFLIVNGHLSDNSKRRRLSDHIADDMLNFIKENSPDTFAKLMELHSKFLDTKEHVVNEFKPRVQTVVTEKAETEFKPSTGSVSTGNLEDRIREELAKMTGYPLDMLESELDLEADLGIDSIQRAELWMVLTKELGISEESRPKAPVRTIKIFAEALAEFLGGEAPASTPEVKEEVKAAPAPKTGSVDTGNLEERIREELAKMTGYPLDMLESELDLEADLGIDSIQRAELWMVLTKELGISEESRPKAPVRTIKIFAEALAEFMGGEAPAPASAPEVEEEVKAAPALKTGSVDTGNLEDRIREELAKMTGYPLDMLESELDLEADLGIDSIQRAELWMILTKELGISEESRPKAPVRTIKIFAEALAEFMDGEAPAPIVEVKEDVKATPAPKTGSVDTGNLEDRIREELAKMTGYPLDMLESELDLEADLGIDSIQRAELWMILTKELGISEESRPKAPVRTIKIFAEALDEFMGGEVSAPVKEEPKKKKLSKKAETFNREVTSDNWDLFARNWVFANSDDLKPFKCSKAAIVADKSDDCKKLIFQIEKQGAKAELTDPESLMKLSETKLKKFVKDHDTIIYVAHRKLAGSKFSEKSVKLFYSKTDELFELYTKLYPLLAENSRRIIVPVVKDSAFEDIPESKGIFSSFPTGFFRSISKELTESSFMLLHAPVKEWDATISDNLDVIFSGFELGRINGAPVKNVLSKIVEPAEYVYPVGDGDLVLVTGGARGIVFECVAALAEKTGCRLLLTGRTAIPEDELVGISFDRENMTQSIRNCELRLVKEQKLSIKDAKKKAAQLKSGWEVRDNLKRLAESGIKGEYVVCDVSDRDALTSLIKNLDEKGDKINGVVHGAGVQRSKILPDLDKDTIDSCITTKMEPVFTMLEALDWSAVKMFNSFTSIAGLFGNMGQTDYSFANDMLAEITYEIGSMYENVSVSAVDWTAWSGTGMVSKEEAERFVKSGLIPVDVPSGVNYFMKAVGDPHNVRLAVFNGDAAFAGDAVSEHILNSTPYRTLSNPYGELDEFSKVNFNLERDSYLSQHVVNGVPVVPGTFVSEIFAENLLSEGKSVKNLKFRRPLAVKSELDVELVTSGDRMFIVPQKRPALEGKGLENLSFSSCDVKVGKRIKEPQWIDVDTKIVKKLSDPSKVEKSSFYSFLDEKFSHALKTGPIFRGIVSVFEEGDIYYSLVSMTRDALQSFKHPGEFKFNPVLADMAVQVASAWNMTKNNVMAIPFSIESFNVFSNSGAQDYLVVCKKNMMEKAEAEFDVAVYEKDGTLVFTMDKLVLKTIAGLDD